MIPQNWQTELKNASISLMDLLLKLDLSEQSFAKKLLMTPDFKIKVCKSYLKKIKPNNPTDPLLLQILPFADETIKTTGFVADPVGDKLASPVAGLIKKYHGRALLLATSVCPIHCRYCFRKNFPYQQHSQLKSAFVALEKDKSITEIILSGGDPLSLSNQKLSALITKLEKIPQLKTLRIHSRFPTALPSRLDDGLLKLFAKSRFNIVLVCHINHPQEIDDEVIQILQKFKTVATLLNQSVLLKNINDSAKIQITLSQKLFAAGILPYYLHLLDKVSGTAHFEVSKTDGLKIIKKMQQKLPGYLIPKLALEKIGEPSKTTIFNKN